MGAANPSVVWSETKFWSDVECYRIQLSRGMIENDLESTGPCDVVEGNV